jgi:hypothetical protein
VAGEGAGAGHWEAWDGLKRSSGIACAPVGESGSGVRAGFEREGAHRLDMHPARALAATRRTAKAQPFRGPLEMTSAIAS